MNNSQNQGRGGFGGMKPLPVMVVSSIAAGIGLAAESIHHHKEKKAAKKAKANPEENDNPPPYEQATDAQQGNRALEEGDEEQWDLDDAQDEMIAKQAVTQNRPRPERDPKKTTQHFIDRHPAPQSLPEARLTLPVVLPQRRPKDRSRGFIRAYAPELEICGIDQTMFLDFLETFNEASLASPLMNAINLAGLAFNVLPTGISQAACLALYLTVQVAKNMQSRARYNSFLDQVNDDFFRPRGLYCMVLTWNPESDQTHVSVNVNETIASNISSHSSIFSTTKNSLRPSMGNTNGIPFMESAPLVFPALDSLAMSDSHEAKTTKEKLKRMKSFTGEYFDRRAQAKYAGENPDSELVKGPKPTFTSRYADPNNPASSGDMLALLTGGKVSMPQRRGFRGGGMGMGGGFGGRGMGMGMGRGFGSGLEGRWAMSGGGLAGRGYGMSGYQQHQGANTQEQQQMETQMQQQNYGRGGLGIGGPGIGFGGLQTVSSGVQRILKHHVLYLLIVNMPSEEEMVHATQVMEESQA